MGDKASVRVAIDAAVLPWRNGGVAHALLALTRSLAQLEDGNEAYCLVVDSEEEEAFWRAELGPAQTVVVRTKYRRTLAGADSGSLGRLKASALERAKPWIRRLRERITLTRDWPEIPISDGFYESLGCDVLHLSWQRFVVCALPTIYNPHDLQHLHLPQFFPPRELAWRETMYPAGCRLARTVVVGSQWVKDDVVRQYGVDPAKVQVIPEGAPVQLVTSIDEQLLPHVKERYRLPETYIVYPAITWPHKNHLRLLDALARLRDQYGLSMPLVLTGTQRQDFWPHIECRIRELRLEQLVHSLGFVPETDLRVILRGARALVQPSLFEASSLPIFDAWLEGVPAACSRAAALADQVGDAALLFDPWEPRDIAEAIAAITTKPDVHSNLRMRGFRRLKDFDWTRTAKAYRAVYRRAAGVMLNDEDRWLLQWDWMREPRHEPDCQLTS